MSLITILMLVLAVLVLLLIIVLILFMPAKMCEIAELKGYNPKEKHIFAICFWFNIFGFLYVLGLPDLKLRKTLLQLKKDTSNLNNGTSESSVDYKICKKCGAQNALNSVTCKDCGEYL